MHIGQVTHIYDFEEEIHEGYCFASALGAIVGVYF